jgi:putative Mg2+ transporter-C (MgtC) family protein
MNWRLILEYLAQLAGAFALAVPIGWERERFSRSAGLRTFPLVAAASCAFVLVGRSFIGDQSEGHAEAHARIIEGLMTGVGFIGGGAILKSSRRVHGTATAAGIWMTGALGAAAGHGRWELAIVASLLTLGTLRWLGMMEKRHLRKDREAVEREERHPDARHPDERPEEEDDDEKDDDEKDERER